ncbi:hypothetical protein [Salinimonas iocasae]|uniref:Uncharacterized protein n=1 Tax=Salinimonas iocasae TaxID=2572577 RepID=A0A5B7YDD6_9ALTE|nr:hypothetical protein [Salinimonas iocasae]QCZ93682.1 hypothetical protein FBQ74_09330 [Salinimonas iocasae]
MRNLSKLAITLGALLALGGCDVDKTQEGEAPEVEADAGNMPEYEVEQTEEGEMPSVDVEGGEMPEYDVDTADVEVGTEKKVVEVPEVDVEMPEDDEEEDKDN